MQKSEKNNSKIERVLIENFVSLQKVMTDQAESIRELTQKIENLLEVFETAAKTLAEKDSLEKKPREDARQIIEKLDMLANQNRVIAKGVSMLHEGEKPESAPFMNNMSVPVPSSPPQQMIIPQMISPIKRLEEGEENSTEKTSEFDSGKKPERFSPLPKL